ncbi:hypothetical protein BDQ17DRAFT_1232430 [Cyathus striatus]|nr:hypothetical protein BDQ17DRAFT_1232430 [Cyathus striatus]
MAGPPLSASFRSAYRLFWRLSSSAVLHKKSARRYLRKMYRPIFDAGARVTKELQEHSGEAALKKQKEDWLKIWNKRVDGTLSLLFSASKSRGLPHRLFYNLNYFVYLARRRVAYAEKRALRWKPNASPAEYARKMQRSKVQKEKLDSQGWNALSEVIGMAEGRDNVSLGRIILRRPAQKTKVE